VNLKKYLKISEMAHIVGINTRTLHYYDEIGLFSPITKDENGYRYYSLEQLDDLVVILSLKELDMPLKEIKTVLSSDVQFSTKTLEKKKQEINQKIESLKNTKKIIEQKLYFFDLAKEQRTQIELIELEEEYLLLSDGVDEDDSHGSIKNIYNFLINEGHNLLSKNEYGAMTHHNKTDIEAYDYFYLKTTKDRKYFFIKPAGLYLRFIFKEEDTGLKNAYSQIKKYMNENKLTMEGYFYERALYETVISNQKEFISEIQIKVNNMGLPSSR
jgi:DNA-binding transcriptional MerR regulator